MTEPIKDAHVGAAAPDAAPELDVETLRCAIQEEYGAVAEDPGRGFHFHTGRPLARMLEYEEQWLNGIPERALGSFAGTGNPFSLGPIERGEHVVDIGCGAGLDSLVAGRLVGAEGRVAGIDMTPAMLRNARAAAEELDFDHVAFHEAFAEEVPLPDGWADVVISNGVLNLMPDKAAALTEMARVLRPGGRLQIADITVQKPISDGARSRIDLWTG